MTKLELKRVHVINCSLDGKISVSEAATAVGLSERRYKTIKKDVKKLSMESIIHGNRGRKHTHTIDTTIAQRIVELKISHKYQEANFLHFQELLEENEILKYRILLFTIYLIMLT